MGKVHSLIIRHGVEQARAMAVTKAERQVVDAAAILLAEEETRLGITHAGFAMTSLPHRRIEEPLWTRQGHRTKLLVGIRTLRRWWMDWRSLRLGSPFDFALPSD